MKKHETEIYAVAITLLMLLAATLGAVAQEVTTDKDGNFVQVVTQKSETDSITGRTFTDGKGQKYEVFKGKRGGLYYWRKSKSGNFYKAYLKTDN